LPASLPPQPPKVPVPQPYPPDRCRTRRAAPPPHHCRIRSRLAKAAREPRRAAAALCLARSFCRPVRYARSDGKMAAVVGRHRPTERDKDFRAKGACDGPLPRSTRQRYRGQPASATAVNPPALPRSTRQRCRGQPPASHRQKQRPSLEFDAPDMHAVEPRHGVLREHVRCGAEFPAAVAEQQQAT
jgi:hypothetical protein